MLWADLSPASINEAKKIASENVFIDDFGSLDYVCDNILTMDLGKEVFDSIVFFSSLHHLSDIRSMINKSYDALKNGGNFIIVEPIRSDMNKSVAEFILVLRSILPTWISYEQKMKSNLEWEEQINEVLDECLYNGDHTQSPNDNSCFSEKEMLNEIGRRFSVKEVEYEAAFIDHIIGGLRGKDKYKLAKMLKLIDDNMVKYRTLPPGIIRVHAVKTTSD